MDLKEEIKKQRELILENNRLLQEHIDKDLDRIMTWREIAKFVNYSIGHLKLFADEMQPFMRGGRRIGARKRHVIEWMETHERLRAPSKKTSQGGLEMVASSGS